MGKVSRRKDLVDHKDQDDLAPKTVLVKVEDVSDSGLHVRLLADGRAGYIRSREISWERRSSVPPEIPAPGSTLEAVILEQSQSGGNVLLSLKRVKDPWKDARKKYKVGDIVDGEVVSVRYQDAHIQVEPGIDAILFPGQTPKLQDRYLEEVFWYGDRVTAEITKLDYQAGRMEISLVRRLQNLAALEISQQVMVLMDYFGADRHPRQGKEDALATSPKATSYSHNDRRPRRLERILVVDNEANYLELICFGLKEELQLPVDRASSGAEALEKLQKASYSLVLLDFRLENETGIEVAERIQQDYPDMLILLMSAAFLNKEEKERIARAGLSYCDKDLIEIITRIFELQMDFGPSRVVLLPETEPGFIKQLGIQALASRELTAILGEILGWLVGQTEATHGLVVEVNKEQRVAKILAAYPPLSPEVQEACQANLYLSPVRQVIEDGREFCQDQVDPLNEARYKNFFADLCSKTFSGLGLPIQIPAMQLPYGLFLIDETGKSFIGDRGSSTGQRLQDARLAVYFLGVAIERAKLLEYMQRYADKYALGYLLGDLLHESSHKLLSLRIDIKALQARLNKPPDWNDRDQLPGWLASLNEHVKKISDDEREVDALLVSFNRTAKNESEPVDVNALAKKVSSQLVQMAKRLGTTIYLDLPASLPPALGIGLQVEQVIYNLVLNAIQMIHYHQGQMQLVAKQLELPAPLFTSGRILIQTRAAGQHAALPIEVRVIDNGPGIRRREWEQIFLTDFSRRGGAGRGLSVSRNLIERMGGRLTLLDSIRYFGSAFLIELQCYPQ